LLLVDITARIESERNLRDSESRTRALVEGAFEGIAIAASALAKATCPARSWSSPTGRASSTSGVSVVETAVASMGARDAESRADAA
jgi:hypothetical protein